MGWSSCGTDNQGRPIGYGHEGICDHPGCEVKIDRGLSYACGGDHGGGEWFCERYFCGEHMLFVTVPEHTGISNGLCVECAHMIESAFPHCDSCGGWGVYPIAEPGEQQPCQVCDEMGILKSEIDWEQSTEYDDNGLNMHDWAVYATHPDIEDSTCKVCNAEPGKPCVGTDDDGLRVVLPLHMIHVKRVAL